MYRCKASSNQPNTSMPEDRHKEMSLLVNPQRMIKPLRLDKAKLVQEKNRHRQAMMNSKNCSSQA